MTSVQQKDTTFTKIFVGGLPYHTADDTLRRFFEPYGQIDEAVVITDRQTGKSRGYGFVTMTDRAAAERACKDPNPIIDGRKANVNLAYLGAKPRLPVGELIAAFPYGLKNNFPSYFGGAEVLGIPQLVYPSAAYHLATTPAAAAATSFSLAAAAAGGVHQHQHHQHPSHLLPSSAATAAALFPGGGQFVDYATLAAFAAAAAAAGTGDSSLQTLTAFPFALQTGTGPFISAAPPGSAPAAYAAAAALPYAATNGLLPNPHTTILGGGGQLTAVHHPYQPPQHVNAKLQ